MLVIGGEVLEHGELRLGRNESENGTVDGLRDDGSANGSVISPKPKRSIPSLFDDLTLDG